MNSDQLDEKMDADETRKFFAGPKKPLSRATLDRGVKQGFYPAPVKIGPKTRRWLRSECQAALDRMIAARDASAA